MQDWRCHYGSRQVETRSVGVPWRPQDSPEFGWGEILELFFGKQFLPREAVGSGSHRGAETVTPPCFQTWLTPPLCVEPLGMSCQHQYLLRSITWLHSMEAFFKKKQLWGGDPGLG